MPPQYTLAERFWTHVTFTPTCWLWNAFCNRHGYGKCGSRYFKTTLTHRRAWELCNGPIPEGLYVCHHCDVPNCVNPTHLFLGTAADNQRDSVAKGRKCVGTTLPFSKLTPKDVCAIREAYGSGAYSQRGLAARYGMSRGAICAVLARRSWRHVT